VDSKRGWKNSVMSVRSVRERITQSYYYAPSPKVGNSFSHRGTQSSMYMENSQRPVQAQDTTEHNSLH